MTTREAQLEILRYWAEVELFTPPEYRESASPQLLWARWNPHAVTADSLLAMDAWRSERWTTSVEFSKSKVERDREAAMPFFTVYFGILPKARLYARLMHLLHLGRDRDPSRTSLDLQNLRGDMFLAAVTLTPWGKIVGGSFSAAGLLGAMNDLTRAERATSRRMRSGVVSASEWAAPTFTVERSLERRDWFEAQFVEFSASQFGLSPELPIAESMYAQREEGDAVTLFDPTPSVKPVDIDFINHISERCGAWIGLEDSLSSAVLVRRHRLDHRPVVEDFEGLDSFYLAELRRAAVNLEAAGAAPHASTYGGRRVPPEDEASPPMPGVPEALASTESWMRPIGAPLARLLEEGDGADVPRIDLLRSPELVRDLLDPAKLPLGRWPSAADHHLYAAQQAAVAAALETGGRFGPLVSLNGPPGTGKSWLLRDIVAEIVVRRAKKIAMLESSAEVFHEGALVSFSVGPNRTWSMTPLLPALTEDELVVVASNNNAAIRNITDEMPRSFGLKRFGRNPKTGRTEKRREYAYWRAAAESLDRLQSYALNESASVRSGEEGRSAGPQRAPVWGLVSATLGRRSNRLRFVRAVLKKRPRVKVDATLPALIEDELRLLKMDDRDPEDAWLAAKTDFLAKLEIAAERRRRMEDILSRTGASPQLFTSSFADRPEQHKTSLWVDEAFERERSEVFLAALELHKATVVAQSERFRKGLAALAAFLENSGISMEAGRAVDVYGFLAFFVPVISTTLASAPRMFEHVREGEIGWVFIDEASQATPYAAAGLLSRAKRAVVLGDPQQLMPVVMMPERITEFLRRRHPLVDARWSPNRTSLQTLADAQMPIGAEIASLTGEPVWTGMPLRTHRRCHSPMFDIANAISYAGQMVQMTPRSDAAHAARSRWLDVPASAKKRSSRPHLDEKIRLPEMAALREELSALENDRSRWGESVFVVSPFRSVADFAQRLVAKMRLRRIAVRADTVHAFQGQEADMVILVLGSSTGEVGRFQRRWAAVPANLLNVAVTRARNDLVVIGDYEAWTAETVFAEAAKRLERVELEVEENAFGETKEASLFDEALPSAEGAVGRA